MGLYEDCIAAGNSAAVCAATFGGPSGGDTSTASLGLGTSAIGLDLFYPDGTYAGRLVRGRVPAFGGGEAPLFLSIPATETEGAKIVSFQGGSFLSPSGGGKAFSLAINAQGGISKSGTVNLDTGSGGGSAPSFASSQAAQTQAEEFARGQAALDRQADIDAAALREKGANLRDRTGALSRLIESFMSSQAQARDTLANMQPDAFSFAAVAGGIAPRGVTPTQAFTAQNQQLASAPLPQFDPQSLPSIESAIQGLQGVAAPQAPPVFGMAKGGIIEMARGADGGYSAAPLPFDVQARLVGENPDGTVNRTTEVMVTSSQGTAIIPLGKGAQEGGFFPFKPMDIDFETAFPTFGRTGLFSEFSEFPQTARTPGGSLRFSNMGGFAGRGAEFLQTLGVRPTLISMAGGEGGIFFRAPGSNELQRISSPQAFSDFGFRSGDVTALSPQTIQEMGFTFGNTLQDIPPVSTERPSMFTPLSVPIIEPTTGTPLPNPATVASELNRLRLTDPATFNLMLNAYENAVTGSGQNAGFSAMNVLAIMQAALPFGQERTLTGLR